MFSTTTGAKSYFCIEILNGKRWSLRGKAIMKTEKWTTRPISPTCEVLRGKSGLSGFCGDPTSYAYPAHGGGWMSLCFRHGQKHLPQIKTIEQLLSEGETFEGFNPTDQ